MNKIILSGILLTISNFSMAEPAYLECLTKNDKNKESTFSIKLDESTGKITHTHGNGSAFNTEGFFTASKITYKSIHNMSGLILTDTYVINRSTLEVSRLLRSEVADPEFAAQIPPSTITNVTGQCDIVKIKNRKI